MTYCCFEEEKGKKNYFYHVKESYLNKTIFLLHMKKAMLIQVKANILCLHTKLRRRRPLMKRNVFMLIIDTLLEPNTEHCM